MGVGKELLGKRKDGSEFVIEISLVPLQLGDEKDGEIVLSTIRDITVQKETERKITTSQAYTRSLIEASLDPLVTISPEGKITDVNEASVKVTGETREKLIGTDFSDYFTEPEKAREGYKQVFEKGFVSDYPLTIRRATGKLIDVLYNASVYKDDQGNVLGVFAAARDVTEQKQSSQYARSLIEASLDPLVTISPEGKITDVNEASAKVTGETREKLIGTDFSDYFTEPEKAREGYKQVFEKGFVSDYPLTIHHTTGKLIDVLYNASVYKDDKGNVLGVFAAARDVTDRKAAEEKVRQSEEKFKSIFDNSLAAVMVADDQGNYLSANKAAGKLLGYSVNELLQMNVSDLKTTAQPGAAKRFEEYIRKGEETGDFDFITKNGARKFAQYQASRIRADFNLSILMDITAQKQASQYARSLIEASLDPLVTISPEGKITDVNEASAKVTGETRGKLIGTDFSDYFTEPEKAREGYKQVFEKGFVSDYPLTIHHASGKLIDVLYNASVYKDDKGNVLGVFAAARDVTEQKQSSQYARSLIEASLDPLVTISAKGKITDVNEALIKVTGVSRDKLIGTDFSDYFTEPDKARKGYKTAFEKSEVANYPLTIRHKNGKLTDVLYNVSVYKDEKEKVLGVFVAARDVTEQNRISAELNEAKLHAELATEIAEDAKIKAEDAVKAKQQFLSNMSHEIRTPMNAIIGFTKVVLKTDLTEKQDEYLQAIKMSGDALIVLINDILDLAKVDSGKMSFEEIPFRIASSISSMLHLFETKILEKNLVLVKDYDSTIPEILVGDSVRLHQIILNLVSNAVKFTNHGKITVSVRMLSEEKKHVTLEIEVADTGIGISKNNLKTIFENFQQASSVTSRIYGGTGLGLAIVKQLVESQGGSVNVTSKIGVGSTFRFSLRFQKTEANFDYTKYLEENGMIDLENYRENIKMKNIKVLVVEDIALNQLLMRTLLEDFGFEFDVAANGKIAIDFLKTKTYDIILMDLQMPIMNGFEASDYIRKEMKSDIPIIALTADVTTADLAKCREAGMNDYLAKPVDERLLYTKMVGLVNKPVRVIELNEIENDLIKHSTCIDLSYLEGRTKSNSALMLEIIELYIDQTPLLVNEIKRALQAKDWDSLKSAAHKMIPSFAIMGMSKDYEDMANNLQEYARNQQNLDEIPELVLRLEKGCTMACKELEIEANRLKNTTHE